MTDSDQVIQAPKSSTGVEIEQLAYVESFDAVADKDYAYVIYKETKAGKWVIRIKGSCTAGATIDPTSSALKGSIKKAAGHDEPFVVWGFNLQSSENDPRMVENRVLIDGNGKPTAVELHLITRKADQSAKEKKVVTVPWPE